MGLLHLAERAAAEGQRRDRARSMSMKQTDRDLDPAAPPDAVVGALKKLADFIPTETISLFWLAIPISKEVWKAVTKVEPETATALDCGAFAVLLLLTPGFVILGYLSLLASQHKPKPSRAEWPWWKAGAAMVAFAAWTLAVPGNPFLKDQPPLQMGAWLLATVLSLILGLIDPIITEWVEKR